MKTVERDVRGHHMKLLASNRSLELCARMNYETEILDVIDRMPSGAGFVDLGACEGRFSIYAALNGLRVVAIEPEKRNYAALRKNIHLNHLSSELIETYQVAIGSENSEMLLRVGQPWEGGHQKVLDLPNTRCDLDFDVVEVQKVKVRSLDDLVATNDIDVPHTMKVDIDGAETIFLEGATEVLANPILKSVVIELQTSDKSFSIVTTKLSGLGFEESGRFQIPNEEGLFNIVFSRD